jgi:DNA-binding NarL/FixJ family response regulator
VAHSILIVETDDLVRLTLCKIFEFFEYRTIDTCSSETALSMLLGVWFGTIILCSTRDDLDGRRIAWEAKAIQPHIKTIVISGFERPKHLPPFVDAFVAKPFLVEDILHAVQTLQAGNRKDFDYETPRLKK